MPKQIKDIKAFLETARRKDVTSIKILKTKVGTTKFKVRTSKYLYTIVIADKSKVCRVTCLPIQPMLTSCQAEKLKQSISSNLKKELN